MSQNSKDKIQIDFETSSATKVSLALDTFSLYTQTNVI